MLFRREYRIDLVASNDPTRPALNRILVEELADKSLRAVATNGYALAAVPVEREEGEEIPAGFTIPLPLFDRARRIKPSEQDRCIPRDCFRILVAGEGSTCILGNGSILPIEKDAALPFPHWEQWVPAVSQNGENKTDRFSFNPDYAADLYRALGSPKVGVSVVLHGTKAWTVRPYTHHHEREPFGLLMPCRGSE